MLKRTLSIASLVALTILAAVTLHASKDDTARPADFTVHEWGTFTSVAGPDGQAAAWLPLAGPNDLPCFVDSYKNRLFKTVGPQLAELQKNAIDYTKARSQLLGPIRMETPVLYFYTPRPEHVDVRVGFPKGFITEWFPQATVNQLVRTGVLERSRETGASIAWKDIEVLPQDAAVSFPQGPLASHYYAARATDANPLHVSGNNEKFLFYRGVGGFPVPINVTVTDEGKIRVKYLTGKPAVILFESHGGQLGYRRLDTTKNEVLADPPALGSDFASLRTELESVLVAEGLYPKEAAAMVETWRDSWFEEGTRVFYIVPPALVETILPLTIEPKPTQISRVFVGRVEVFTPETIQTVQQAIAANDTSVIAAYGRFLGPIAERIPPSKRVSALLSDSFNKYINQPSACSK